jgi:hypothetical protein
VAARHGAFENRYHTRSGDPVKHGEFDTGLKVRDSGSPGAGTRPQHNFVGKQPKFEPMERTEPKLGLERQIGAARQHESVFELHHARPDQVSRVPEARTVG